MDIYRITIGGFLAIFERHKKLGSTMLVWGEEMAEVSKE
jgi:hypothetical protein